MKIPESIIKEGIRIAWTSNVKRGKLGAVLFNNNGHIICSASNKSVYGNPKTFTIHAEEHLLWKAFKLKATERLGKLNVLVVRVLSSLDGVHMAKPCPKCKYLLSQVNLETYYSDENGEITKL